jgi:hypothetical protein
MKGLFDGPGQTGGIDQGLGIGQGRLLGGVILRERGQARRQKTYQ